MPWRDVPRHLRPQVSRTDVLAALPAAVLMPVLTVVCVMAPFFLAVLFFRRGDHVLAALMVPLMLAWGVGLTSDPGHALLGLFGPAALWDLVQRARGKVQTDHLEDGRYVPLDEYRAATAQEAAELERFIAQAPVLREHLRGVRVRGECWCGCGSVLLSASGDVLPPEHEAFELTAPDGVVLRVERRHAQALERPSAAHPVAGTRGG